jgi:hypothetical protein
LASAFAYDGRHQPSEEIMETLAQLMQRLLEIQSGGRKRSPELVAEDGRLMNDPQKKITEKKLSQFAVATKRAETA